MPVVPTAGKEPCPKHCHTIESAGGVKANAFAGGNGVPTGALGTIVTWLAAAGPTAVEYVTIISPVVGLTKIGSVAAGARGLTALPVPRFGESLGLV